MTHNYRSHHGFITIRRRNHRDDDGRHAGADERLPVSRASPRNQWKTEKNQYEVHTQTSPKIRAEIRKHETNIHANTNEQSIKMRPGRFCAPVACPASLDNKCTIWGATLPMGFQ